MKYFFILKKTFCLFITLMSILHILHAEMRIEITQGVDIARPIGVVPFQELLLQNDSISKDIENIGSIVAADLRNSGKFNPLDISRLPQHPISAAEIIPNAWMSLGIDAIVIGKLLPSSNNTDYVVSYQLIKIQGSSSAVLIQNQFKVSRKWLRYAAHSVSDEIFEKLTGIKGAFCTRIAYVAHTSRSQYPYELRVADYDGYNQISVYRSLYPLMSPAWSPDGNKLAYVTFEGGHSALVIQTLNNGSIRKIANFPQHNGAPSFSPDGRKLAFALSKTGSLNLYVMDLISDQINQITYGRSNNTEPTWFPDNHMLVYTSDQGGRPQVYKIDIKGDSMPQRLSWEDFQNQDADVSPDGSFLVMVNSKNGAQHIAKLNLITGEVQILTDTFLDETPSISPNGAMIIYSSSHESNSVLQLVSADGNFKARLTPVDEKAKFPAWSPYM